MLYTKCAPNIPHSTSNFPFTSNVNIKVYLLYCTVHLICTFSSAAHQKRTYYTLQYNLFSLLMYCTPKCVPTVQYSSPYFHFFKCCTPNAYVPYPTVHLIFYFQVLYTKIHAYCTLQYTLFSLFQVLYAKCVPTIPYNTPYSPFSSTLHHNMYLVYSSYIFFLLFNVLYIKCVTTLPYSTPYFTFSITLHQNENLLYSTVQLIFTFCMCCTPNAYLLYPTLHLIFKFSRAIHKMRTYYYIQYTLFACFQVLYTNCVPRV